MQLDAFIDAGFANDRSNFQALGSRSGTVAWNPHLAFTPGPP
jgi:hypothetical protein